jgi:dephospho-CoA kinase
LDVPVYESDVEAKALYRDPQVGEAVRKLFGPAAYQESGLPDTRFLAEAIYRDPGLREQLNGILHPAVRQHYGSWLARQTHPYVLKVAALLFEADIARELDFTLLVLAPENERAQRVRLRDSFRPEAEIHRIMEAQWPDDKKIALADGCFFNDGKQSVLQQVETWNVRFLALKK